MRTIDSYESLDCLSDEELVALCADESNGVSFDPFAELSVRYLFVIRGKVQNISIAGVDPDDLFQEGLIGLSNAVKSYSPDGGASFRTYADVCISHRIISLVRSVLSKRNMINHLALPLCEQFDETSSSDTEPEKVVVDVESLRELWEKIKQRLSEMEFRVLELYLEGGDYDSISERLCISRKSCDNAMQRVRKKLRTLK